MNTKTLFNRAKSIAIIFALLAITVSFNSCTQTKLKKIEGNWTLNSSSEMDNSTTTNVNTGVTTLNKQENSTSFNGSTETVINKTTNTGGGVSDVTTTETVSTVSKTLEIKDDGTFTQDETRTKEKVTATTALGTVITDFGTTTVTSSVTGTWWFSTADKKNDRISFQSAGGGTETYVIDESSKDELKLTMNDSGTNTSTDLNTSSTTSWSKSKSKTFSQ